MEYNIRFGWIKGQTGILADVFQPDGSVRQINIALTENATGRAYLGKCPTAQPGDMIVYHQNGRFLTSQGYEDRTGYKLASDGLDSISTAEPSGVASNFREMLVQTWRRLFKKVDRDKVNKKIRTYRDDGNVATIQSYTKAAEIEVVNGAE